MVDPLAKLDDTRRHKLKVNDAVKRALKDPAYSFNDDCFEAGIEYRSSGVKNKTTFMVHHRIQGDSMDNDLREWATDQKLVPWVAVAAQLPVSFPSNSKVLVSATTHIYRQTLHTVPGDRFSRSCRYRFSTASLSTSMGSSVYRPTVLDCIS